MSLQKVDRISILVTRRPEVSEKDFHKYWADNHGPLVQEMLCKYGIIKYTQFHMTPEYKAKGPTIGAAASYDGIAEFIVNKFEDMAAFFADPVYMEKIRPDEAKFVDIDKIVFTSGVDYVVVENNKPVVNGGGHPW